MKKALVLVLVLLVSGFVLYGCGSNGGASAPSNGGNSGSNNGGGAQLGPVTAFTLNMVDSNGAPNLVSKVSVSPAAAAMPAPTDVRVVIRSFATVTTTHLVCPGNDFDNEGYCNVPLQPVDVGSLTEVYRDIQDVRPSGSSVQIGIPSGTSFTLDVITSQATSTNQNILKYGQVTNLSVPNTGNTATVPMRTVGDILNMTVNDTITANQVFTVTLNNAMPFAPNYTMIMSFVTGTGTITSQVTTASNKTTFTAPATYDNGNVTMQGLFTLNPSCLKKGETNALWTRPFPYATYGEQVYGIMNPYISVTVPNL